MNQLAPVLCLDFEASSLAASGYPLEVGLADPVTGESWGWLIRPVSEWIEQGEWSARSAAVHGITRELIDSEGQAISDVIDTLNGLAYGRALLSDNPAHDSKWLSDLYRAAGYIRPPFMVENFLTFAEAIASQNGLPSAFVLEHAEEEARAAFPVTHRAAQDARYLAEILRRIAREELENTASLNGNLQEVPKAG